MWCKGYSDGRVSDDVWVILRLNSKVSEEREPQLKPMLRPAVPGNKEEERCMCVCLSVGGGALPFIEWVIPHQAPEQMTRLGTSESYIVHRKTKIHLGMTLKVTGIGNSKATVYLKFTLLWRTQPHMYTLQPVTQAGHILSQSFNIFLLPSPTLTPALSYFPQSPPPPPPPPPPLSTLMCCVLSLSIPQQRMSFRGTLRIGSRPGITQRSQREMARPSPRCVLMHYSHPLILSSSLLMLPCLSVWASLRTWIYMHCLLSPDGCPTDHFVRLFVSSVPLYDESSECVLTGLLETLTWLLHSSHSSHSPTLTVTIEQTKQFLVK